MPPASSSGRRENGQTRTATGRPGRGLPASSPGSLDRTLCADRACVRLVRPRGVGPVDDLVSEADSESSQEIPYTFRLLRRRTVDPAVRDVEGRFSDSNDAPFRVVLPTDPPRVELGADASDDLLNRGTHGIVLL